MSESNCSCGLPWRDVDNRCARCKRNIPSERTAKLEFHRSIGEIADCKCSDTVKASWGSRTTEFEGFYLCNFCDSKASDLNEINPVDDSKVEQFEEIDNPKLETPIANRTARENLEVVETLLTNLSNTKKYRRAIASGEFAQFSLIGTSDWEDYASLSVDALQLLTLAQINANLEAIKQLLEEK